MADVIALMSTLQAHLQWHCARLFVRSALVLALLRLRTIHLAVLACTLHPVRSIETSYRRLQRFFAFFQFDFDALAELLLAPRVHTEPLVLVMDRTEWHVGTRTINLLVVGYLEPEITVPLVWQEFGKAGATGEEERIALPKRVLPLVEPRRAEVFVADREFVGEQFFAWLCRQNFRFVLRIRQHARLYHRGRRTIRRADEVFASFAGGSEQRLRDRHLVYGTHLYVVAARQGQDPWILVTNAGPAQAPAPYRKRWSVERGISHEIFPMLGVFKSRGFDLEATHLTESDRIERLVGVLALALVWALRVGLWRAEQVAVVVKKHRRRAKSLFRHGFDYLREHLLNHDWAALRPAFQVRRVLRCHPPFLERVFVD